MNGLSEEMETEIAPPAPPAPIKTGKQVLHDDNSEPQEAGQDVMAATKAATETTTAAESAPPEPAGAAAAGDNSSVIAGAAALTADIPAQQPQSENGVNPPVVEPLRRGEGWAPIKAEFIRPKDERGPPTQGGNAAEGGAASTAGTTGDARAGSEGKKNKKRARGRNHQRPSDKKPPQGGILCPEVATGAKCKFGESCRYSHDIKNYLANKGPDIADTCPIWDVRGSCPSGLKCRFSSAHTNPDTLMPIVRPGTVDQSSFETLNDLDRQLQGDLRRNKVRFACDRRGWKAFLLSLDAEYPDSSASIVDAAAANLEAGTGKTVAAACGKEAGTSKVAATETAAPDTENADERGHKVVDGVGDAVAMTSNGETKRGGENGCISTADGSGVTTTTAATTPSEATAGADNNSSNAQHARSGDPSSASAPSEAAAVEQDPSAASPGTMDVAGRAQDPPISEMLVEVVPAPISLSKSKSPDGDVGNGTGKEEPPVKRLRVDNGCASGTEAGVAVEQRGAGGGASGPGVPETGPVFTAGQNRSCQADGDWVRMCLEGQERRESRKVDFEGKVYVAPLTTVGNLPFRRLVKGLGADITCGEMAIAHHLLKGQGSEWALLRRHPCEDMFGVQVAGAHPDQMTRVAELLEKHAKVDFVDINMGCPIDLVCDKGMGAALMNRGRKLRGIIAGMTSQLSCPLTVKMRVGWDDKKPNADTVVRTVQREAERCRSRGFPGSVAYVMVHGRSRLQRYSRLADWSYVRKVATSQDSALKPVPVIGNGDILSWRDHEEHLQQARESQINGEMGKEGDDGDDRQKRWSTCCMLARGALIKPWLPTEVKERRDWDISSSERLDIYRDFVRYGLEHWGSDQMGVNKTRRFLLEWLSFTHRYIPVGLLEVLPQRINERPLPYYGRNELEGLMCSQNAQDWVKISEMLLGPVPTDFEFEPKHKANSYAPVAVTS